MSEGDGKTVRDLHSAIREIRIAQAERTDAAVELRDAEQARLDLLAEALQSVADDIPENLDQFSLAVLPGNPPRFWVDATSFVMLARDRRTYRFLRDTRLGRSILVESPQIDVIADAVTAYVAERIVEGEQAIAAGWTPSLRKDAVAAPIVAPAKPQDMRSVLWGFLGFALGIVGGILLLLAFAWITAS
ncbi:hypothetical protein SAMN05216548_101391 [Faunimonas pinastri]|uniref:Uncharacterized protein n=1 Tax=Faunimonas pinastri TaxID=1855383 RepID=A0A1H9AEP4_9HYPH|nr:hypothetical protein [Faunimonas pinastri]SEP74428.1 hypothetical protein SAMN05216548_101391 [Faunimonas pinastri]